MYPAGLIHGAYWCDIRAMIMHIVGIEAVAYGGLSADHVFNSPVKLW